MLLGDFNAEDAEPVLSKYLLQYEAENILKNKTCFKNPDRPTCIDLFVTNSTHSFQNTVRISIGLSNFHKMIITVLKSSFIKLKGRAMYYRDYKNFTTSSLGEGLTLSLNNTYSNFKNIITGVPKDYLTSQLTFLIFFFIESSSIHNFAYDDTLSA